MQATVYSPDKLTAAQLKKLEEYLAKKYAPKGTPSGKTKFSLSQEVDENLLAGIKLQVGSDMIDLSARAKLDNLRENLLKI